jgi:hypothetical protein
MEDVLITESRGKLVQMKTSNKVLYPIGSRIGCPYVWRIMNRGDEVILDFTVNPRVNLKLSSDILYRE